MTTQHTSRFVSHSLSNHGDHTMRTNRKPSGKNVAISLVITLTAYGVLLAERANAAPISGVSYVYNNLAQINSVAGKDAPTGVAQSLTDGLGQAGVYTPTSFFWDAGQEGTIFLEDNVNIAGGQPQPSVTFDLGSVVDLDDLIIHYGERTASGIEAPLAVDVTVGATFVGNFGGFDQSSSVANFGDIRSNTIDLSGQSGQFVTLDFLGDQFPSGTDTWLGLTEVEFFAAPVPAPEPSTFVLVGLGLVGVCVRRRHRNRG